jgi:hypothetical protein
MGALLAMTDLWTALVGHTAAAAVIFLFVAKHYFGLSGARDPLPTAVTFVSAMALLDLVVVAGLVQHSLQIFTSVIGTWLPFFLVFLVTWGTGVVMSVMPTPSIQQTSA